MNADGARSPAPGRLARRVAIVTGAARGIGKAVAEAFLVEGAAVTIGDVCPREELSPDMRSLLANGSRLLYVESDVSLEADVGAMVDRVLCEFGRIDILVNNAGVFERQAIEHMTLEEWDRVINVDLRSVYLCSRSVLPTMLRQGNGTIINIASQLGQVGESCAAHYCAAKGGVLAFTRALAREVGRRGIRVNAIAPGPIETEMNIRAAPEWRAAKLHSLPIGRFGTPAEVAQTAVFLACDDSSYYLGQTLGPNGGDVMV